MNDATFTPGPWEWQTSNSFTRLGSASTGKDGDVLYASAHPRDGVATVVVPNEANARLIAAAPLMYEALSKQVEWAERAVNPSARMPDYDFAVAALDAADGEARHL